MHYLLHVPDARELLWLVKHETRNILAGRQLVPGLDPGIGPDYARHYYAESRYGLLRTMKRLRAKPAPGLDTGVPDYAHKHINLYISQAANAFVELILSRRVFRSAAHPPAADRAPRPANLIAPGAGNFVTSFTGATAWR